MKINPFPLLLYISTLFACTVGVADESNWIQPAGGSFGVPENWSDGVPGVDDWGVLSANKTNPEETSYTVTLDMDRTLAGLYVNAGDFEEVKLDLGGYKLTLTSDSTSNHSLRISATHTLLLENGQLDTNTARVGQSSSGKLIVGAGATWLVNGASVIGNAAPGDVRVENGGKIITTSLLQLAANSGSGVLILDGPEASISGSSNINIGSSGTGNAYMEITNGASLNRSGHVQVASNINGTLLVHNGSTFTLTGSFRIGGRNDEGTAVGGIGLATFASGAQANLTRITMYSGNTFEIDGATVTVSTTSSTKSKWFADSIYRVHLHEEDDTPFTVDTLTMDGAILDVQLGSGFDAVLGGVYSIINYTQSITGKFVDKNSMVLDEGASINVDGYIFTLSYGELVNGVVSLELTMIPEPSQMASIAAAIGLVLWCRRRGISLVKKAA